jgi:hypothetical protein
MEIWGEGGGPGLGVWGLRHHHREHHPADADDRGRVKKKGEGVSPPPLVEYFHRGVIDEVQDFNQDVFEQGNHHLPPR